MVNIQNTDSNRCFKWCLVKYPHPADHNPKKIRKVDKDFARQLDFKELKFLVKIRDIHKIERKNCISTSVFGYGNKQNYPIFVSRNTFKNHVDLLLTGEEGKGHYFLIKDFSTFMYDHTLHRGRKHFCRYCLQAFSPHEILKCHINNCVNINGKQRIEMPENGEHVRFKNYKMKVKSLFMIYADFERILVLEDSGKQNANESYKK